MRFCTALLCFAALLGAGTARADEDSLRKAQAETRFQEGLTLHAQGRDREARLRFEQANAVLGTPNTLLNLARTEQLTGDDALAARHYRECIKSPQLVEKGRALARKYLSELEQQVAQIRVVVPDGTTVLVDGAPVVGALSETVYVHPGLHTVSARLSGSEQHVDGVKTVAGSVTTVELLRDLQIVARVDVGPSTTPAPPLPAPAPATMNVEPPPSAAARDTSFWTTRSIVVVSLGGAALAAAGVGVALGTSAQSKSDDVRSLRAGTSCVTGCTALTQALDSQRQDAHLANGFFVASAVLAAGSLGVLSSLLFAPDGAGKSGAVAPVVFYGGAGLAMQGRF